MQGMDSGARPGTISTHPGETNGRLVAVASTSSVSSIVVSRIVERSGMKALSFLPDQGCETVCARQPGMVILDGGADDQDCADLLRALRERRNETGDGPAIVFLASAKMSAAEREAMSFVDEIVTKPIMPENLQPAIYRLSTR